MLEEIDLGGGYAFCWLNDGNAMWRHPEVGKLDRARCGRLSIDLTSGMMHHVIAREPLTLTPSLLCPAGCGEHGFIRAGRWEPA